MSYIPKVKRLDDETVKNKSFIFRLNKAENEKLQYLEKRLNLTRSEVLRLGYDMLYSIVVKTDTSENEEK